MNFRTQYNVEPAKGEELDDTVVTIPNQAESISSIMRKIELGLPITASSFIDLSDVSAESGIDRMYPDRIELLQANFLAQQSVLEEMQKSKKNGDLNNYSNPSPVAAAAAEPQSGATDEGMQLAE